MQYNPKEIEPKWQNNWIDKKTFKADNESDKPKFYVLDMFPYPSGAGLHVGHPLGYIASDIYSRYKRLKGFNVLHPLGYDSFGLPAEQYAIQTGQHPAVTTKVNIEGGVDKQGNEISGYENQLKKIGLGYDWDREIRTSNPEYYKWTQWIFNQLFDSYYDNDTNKAESISQLTKKFSVEGNASVNAVADEDVEIFTAEQWNTLSEKEQQAILLKYRLTFLAEAEVNWCPDLGTVLANDEVINGLSERGGYPVIRKKMTQWMMRITAYADRLLSGLDTIDWSDAIKEAQRNWIGKSQGASIFFGIDGHDEKIEVFTTRPDTVFGVSYVTLAPEHPLVSEITTAENKEKVEAYVDYTSKRSERDRLADAKNITGEFTGAYAIHPFTGKQVPIWIGDYVLASYGTGAVMAVPCGDERDFAFANHFDLPIINIFKNQDISEAAFTEKGGFELQDSDFLNGLSYKEAVAKAIAALEENGFGKGKTNFRLREAVFSRQRYWGEPVPVYFKDEMPYTIPTEALPIILPEVDEYLPTKDGEPPLGRATEWAFDTLTNKVVDNSLINNETIFPIELNTMPGWAGSSWYWLRYMDADNDKEFVSKDAVNYWENVDLYMGGSEHATGHLLYSRFWQKFLFDKGFVPTDEYAKKLINQGMILGMSAFAYRINGTNTFVSKSLKDQHETTPIHVDVNILKDGGDELDFDKFKAWREDYANAEFILEDGKYITGREVEKMSKSKYNVISPDTICDEYGADSLRLYEMFLGPLEQTKPWNTQGLSGVYSFLKKFWRLYHGAENEAFFVSDDEPTKEEMKVLHQTIKKVDEDVNNFSFNTSVSTFMIAVNELGKLKTNKRSILEPLAIIISPYAPHIAEELWEKLGHETSIANESFPALEEKWLVADAKEYPVSFNGKMKFLLELPLSLSKDEIQEIVMKDERTIKQLGDRTPKNIIIVPGKIINIVG
ncbi:leucyl-tRNA synthetase [Chishuiella changwenlii]|uniref:Leucine--tRNA ligase n=1 Tax=Chishuiella changwenlii TaxID=1434701 RepID=A0A1M6YUN2_9FLAO|nr:leucine--tRNA ligase [Chishuiella changwenlii]GGE88132.1 leucine--tRNA ligase [Chishuiella changwenlii]SHL21976.1 leucyl-tRNA synthetase [Chishuiella changwenlii]